MAQPPARVRLDQLEEREVQTEFFSFVQHSQDQNGLLFVLICAWHIELCLKNNNKACSGSWSCSSVGKGSACNEGNRVRLLGWEDHPGEVNDTPLQYSCLENPMDRGAWQATVHGVTRVGHDLAAKLLLLHVCVCVCVYIYIYIYTHIYFKFHFSIFLC